MASPFPCVVLCAGLLSVAPLARGQDIGSRFATPGPWPVDKLTTEAACDRKGDRCDVFYPRAPGRAAPKFPVVTWGNGTDATPSPDGKYDYLLRHIASWGFVVVASKDGAAGAGGTILDAANFMRAANADPRSPLYGRLDLAHIGAAGHSQGASGAANAMLQSDGEIATAVLLHLPQQAFCKPVESCLRTADLQAAHGGSLFYVSGAKDFVISPDWLPGGGGKLNSLTAYYEATPEAVPKVKAILKGADHNDLLGRPDCPPGQMGCSAGVGGYLGYVTAWLVWRLQGRDNAAAFREGGELGSSRDWAGIRSNIP